MKNIIENFVLTLPALIYIVSVLILILDISVKELNFGWLTIVCGVVVIVGAIGFALKMFNVI